MTPPGNSAPEGPSTSFTVTQAQRLRELDAPDDVRAARFDSAADRDARFKEIERDLVAAGRRRLADLRGGRRRPALLSLEERLATALTQAGFVQVVTPLIITAEALRRMGIEPGDPLNEQVFWVEGERCLRPMLAPNLYTLLRRLTRVWERPFGLFEIGPCFRRDTKGSQHLNEFTMLNLVELGTPAAGRQARLSELARLVVGAAGVSDYQFVTKESEVYGDTVDVVAGGIELASAAMGPHPLDDAWGITEPWVGLGFGLERLLVACEGGAGIERVGRSLRYLDGVRLNL